MTVVFAHDHILYKYEDKFYSNGGLSSEVLQRYVNIYKDITVISRQKKIDVLTNKLTLASINKVRFVGIPNFKSIKTFYKIIEAKKIVENEIRQSDCLIARLPSSIGSLAIKYAIRYNKPYLIEFVGCPWDALWNHSLKGKLIAPFMYFTTKKTVREANYVVYVTNKFLQKKYPTNGKSVNCSNVSLKEFNDNVIKARLNKINNMKDTNKIVIGTIAAVDVRYKGQQFVIEALGKLKRQDISNYEYQLVGGGNQTYLKLVAKKFDVMDQIKFLGPIPHSEVFDWLDTIDIYVQPSRTEGLPRALVEAMSRGLPAFGANTGGIPELLEPEYIFSNTCRNIDEICNIIQSFNKDTMIIQAQRNYAKSKKYDKAIIEERRRQFFMEFNNSVKN